MDTRGNVYVADYWNYRVQVFGPTGNFLLKWGSQGSAAGQFLPPVDVAVRADGVVYVTDGVNNRVQKFGQSVTAAHRTTWGRLKSRFR